tara:strand:+ start:1737 stop:2345 length:609 start_codon:yes stop_codon:yes gene_type:complete
MATLKLNTKTLATQTSSAEPVIASTVTGGAGLSGMTSLGTVTTATLGSNVVFPSQYNFYVKMSANAAGNNDTWTVVPLNTLVWGTFNTTDYKFVVPKAGKWMFFYSVRFKDGAYGRFLALSIGGTILSGGASSTIARPGGHVSYGTTTYNSNYFNHACLNLAEDDEIKLHFKHIAGNDTNTINYNDDGFDTTFFTGFRLLGG